MTLLQPRNLKSLSESSIVSCILKSNHFNLVSGLQVLPSTLLNNVVKLVLKSYNSEKQVDGKTAHWPATMTLVKRVIALRALNVLDLTDVFQKLPLGEIPNAANTFISYIPVENNLTQIFLPGIRSEKNGVISVCDSLALYSIGQFCQKLQVLNVSFNPALTDEGIEHLMPSAGSGCGNLKELFVYGCKQITNDCLMSLLERIPSISQIGFKQMGELIFQFHKKNRALGLPKYAVFLNILHIDNIGERNVTYNDLRLKSYKTAVLSVLCPFLESLRIRVLDDDLPHLATLVNLKSLDLFYHCKRVGSPGENTMSFLKDAGFRLKYLRIRCAEFRSSYFQVIRENCQLLENLSCRCNKLVIDNELNVNDKESKGLPFLRSLHVRIGANELYECDFPPNIVQFLIERSLQLETLFLAVHSSDLNDQWVKTVLESIAAVNNLKKFHVEMPGNTKFSGPTSDLSMESAERVVETFRNLTEIGNLVAWNISEDELTHFKDWSSLINCELKVIFKEIWAEK